MTVQIPHPSVVLHGDGIALACGLDGEVRADELHGMFVGDTRVLSSYRIMLAGQNWQLVGRNREGHGTATWTFQNPLIRTQRGEVAAGSVFLKLRRRVAGAFHDDLTIRGFGSERIETRLIVQLDSDFADIFEVKDRRLPPRLDVVRTSEGERLMLRYERAGFCRALHVRFSTSGTDRKSIEFVGSQVIFDIALNHAEEWTCCIHAEVELDGAIRAFAGDPHDPEPDAIPETAPTVRSEPVFQLPFERGSADLHALAVKSGDTSYVSAGVPWFLCLFGRDTLVTALMSGVLGDWPARGALAALAALQSTVRDDWRDAEPGKLPHELRRGELAFRKEIPHGPYYGTHDAPALYCLTLWNAWRWTGDESLLGAHLGSAQRALEWCDDSAIVTATDSRNTRRAAGSATTTRVGRTPPMQSSNQRAGSPNCRLPPSSCRDISTRRDSPWRSCLSTWVTMPKPSACVSWRWRCALLSRSVTGSRTRAFTPSPWTATKNRCEQSVPTPGSCCGAVCRARTMPAGQQRD